MFNKKKMTSFKSIEGGILFQTNDNKTTTKEDLKIENPSSYRKQDLIFSILKQISLDGSSLNDGFIHWSPLRFLSILNAGTDFPKSIFSNS